MAKGTRYGREAQEAAWQSAEVDALHRLFAAGVRVPAPRNFCDGVLLMELVSDADGECRAEPERLSCSRAKKRCAPRVPAARGGAHARRRHVIHGDLSEFNILLAEDGPVIIDLPQAVDAAGNNHAKRLLVRDVVNLRDFFGRFAPALRRPTTATRSGTSTSAACCSPTCRSPGASKARAARWTWPG
jgi:RIO kinase 1